MKGKRVLDCEVDESRSEKSQKQSFKFTKYLSTDDLEEPKYSTLLENALRKPVREETEKAILRSVPFISRLSQNQAEQPKSRKLKLLFVGSLPDKLFTENEVKAEGPSPVKLVLLDELSEHIVTDGPFSMLKVEIVALHGHFKAELLNDWNRKDFNDNIVLARNGKRPLLLGERVIALRNGVGFIDGIQFSDNSSWVRSKRFRLGARAVLAEEEDQVREAVSSPFQVKDRRGETYKKHNTDLSLEDEVWRLKGISKDGKICRRLAQHKIVKVKDFIQQYHTDQSLLCSMLGLERKPKMWETIVQQATGCCSSNVHINTSDIPTASISPCTIPSLSLQDLCAPAASQDQPIGWMSQNHGTEHDHKVGQSIPLNQEQGLGQAPAVLIDDNPLMANLLAAGSYDEGHNCSLHYPTTLLTSPNSPLNLQDMYNVPTPNWCAIAPRMGEEGNNSLQGSTSTSHVGTLPFFFNMDPSSSKSFLLP